MIVSRKISVQAATALLAAFAAVVLLAAMPSTAAALNWPLPATDLSDGPANNAAGAQVAVAADGATTVVWTRRNDAGNNIVQARTRPAGSGTFGVAVDLSAAGRDAASPQVAVGVDGATTVVWRRWNGSNSIVQARTRPAGSGTFAGAVDLSAAGQDAGSPQVAVAVDGATTVVWSRNNGSNNIVQASTRPAGSGTFGGAVNLSATGQHAYEPQVAVAVDGATTVVWTRSNSSNSIVQARTRPAGSGTFAVVEDLSAPLQHAGDPQLAVAVNGATTVVWTRSNGSNNIIQARTRPAGGAFGVAVNLSVTGENAGDPQVAVGVDGATTVVWRRLNGLYQIVQARTRPAGGAFATAVDLSAGQPANLPQVAVAGDGSTTVVWRRWNGFNYIVQARTRPAGSVTFAVAVDLSAGQTANNPQVAVGVDGATTVVWARSNGSNQIVQARTRPAGSGTFAVVEDLSTAGQDAVSPQVAVGVDGATTVVWARYNGVNNIVQARTRPAGSVTFAVAENLSAAGQHADYPQVAVGVNGAATVVWQRSGPIYTRIQQSTSKYLLTLTRSGTGSGSVSSGPAGIDCGLVCSYSFSLSTSVTLTASPAAGSTFTGWSGSGCSGTSTCTVTMSAARAINAAFTLVPPGHFNLALTKSGTGRGTVTSSPAGINCGSDCSETLVDGSSIRLTAKPTTGSSFAGWSGSGCSGTSTCTVTMSAARTVNAKFTTLPSNRFTVRSVKVGVNALTSTVVIPGPGKLTQRVTRKSKTGAVLTVCKTSAKVTKAGRVKLTCKLSSATRAALRKRSLRVSVKTTFTPTGGLKASKTKLIKLPRRH